MTFVNFRQANRFDLEIKTAVFHKASFTVCHRNKMHGNRLFLWSGFTTINATQNYHTIFKEENLDDCFTRQDGKKE